MNMAYEPVETGARTRRSVVRLLAVPGIAFLLGLVVMGWLLSNWDTAARFVGTAPPRAVPIQPAPQPAIEEEPEAPAGSATAAAEPQRLVIDPEITRRVNRIERRIGEIDAQSRAAVGNADRAEGLLVAFAARRALDRGVALGFLEGLLRQRFGESQPQAVGTIIRAAREPVTLEELQEELKEVGPQLTGPSPDQDWWSALRAELGNLATVRREGTPSTVPAERLRRATRRLEAGQVDVALAEVLRMPGRVQARQWIADARRYVSARRALDTIETAALLDPRNPPQVEPPASPRQEIAD